MLSVFASKDLSFTNQVKLEAMLDSSAFLENSGGSASDGMGVELRNEGGSGGVEESERNSAGNRWPREETLALLKIRSDMDLAFRDSTLKAPLWDEVSRLHFHFPFSS